MTVVRHRVLHVSDDPVDSQLLQSQLAYDLVDAEIQRIEDARSLAEQVALHDRALLVVDLPVSDALNRAISRMREERPAITVLFRWQSGSTWQYADDSEPLASIVRQTLRVEPTRPQNASERRRTLDRIVRGQEVLLRLAETDFWEFEAGLHTVTAALAGLLQVERVSVWEFDASHSHLHCLDLYERTPNRHSRQQVLADFPRYLRALSTSLILAADDAREDPRTDEFKDDYLVPLGITSMLDAPIRRRGHVQGVVCVEHVGVARTWDVVDQCQIASTATLLANALELRDRRALERRLEESQRLSAIGRTASQLAHDFNNRLMLIGVEFELACEAGTLPPGTIAAVRTELEKAHVTARNLMSLNRQRPSAPTPLALGPPLTALAPALQRLLGPETTLSLDVHAAPLRVAIAGEDFEQVLVNLVTNARDALPRGGHVLVALAPTSTQERAVLRVEDNGSGMSEETRARLFEPLATTKSADRGSGMGLASVFAVVQAARGEIWVDSAPGLGTRVRIELPLA